MIIGLTGKNGAGKGVAAEFLKERGFIYFSLSDIVREEVSRLGLPITRDNLIKTGVALRETYGSSVMADRILERIDFDKNYVIDSFRSPYEVEAFRRKGHFALVEVLGDPKIRFERMKARARENDPIEFDLFLVMEKKEESTSHTGQQLSRTGELADARVENNGTVEDFYSKLKLVMADLGSRIERPSWDAYFAGIARMVAMRSNCIKRKVAALIIQDKRIISTGYNGTPRGVKNCNEGGCDRCNQFEASGKNLSECLCSHAEENAITQAAYHGVRIKGASIFTTFSPCLICTKMIINSGLQEVIYSDEYNLDDTPRRLLIEAGILVRQFQKNEGKANLV